MEKNISTSSFVDMDAKQNVKHTEKFQSMSE